MLPNNPNESIDYSGISLSEIVLAGGCFWGTQAYICRIPGVAFTECGYANGHTEKPTYEEVCTGETGHAEAVCVCYDRKRLPLSTLLHAYFETVNPTTRNRQGNDFGSQYRTGIYYTDPSDLPEIQRLLEEIQQQYISPIVTEVESLSCFYRAEEYHQDYLEKHPNGYCHVDLSQLEERD